MIQRWPWWPFLGLYALLALTFFALMRDHAFHPTDDGFVLAYSWRLAQGEVPYRDFLYVRTPLSPLLHLPWLALPEGWPIPAGRLAFYVELAAAAMLPTAWAVSRGLRATVPALAVCGGAFLLSLHNFPPMPWPTVDAVFLASAGATAFLVWIDRRRPRWLMAATALLTLSALAKQSFAPLVVLVVAYAVVVAWRRRDLGTLVAALGAPLALAAALGMALIATGALTPFVQQLSASMQMRPTPENPWTGDIVSIGVVPYVSALNPAVAITILLVTLVFVAGARTSLARPVATPTAVSLLAVGAFVLPSDTNLAGILVFLGIAAIVAAASIRSIRGPVEAQPLVAYAILLAAGWCASLSFAYQTPLLALGMLGPVVALELPIRPTRWDSAIAMAGLVVTTSIVTLLNVDAPYRDLPRAAQTADLGDIYPRLGHLYTNPINADRHRELRDLSERFALRSGRDFVVLTGFPLAHYLSGTRNPLSLDWLEPQEYVGNEERLRREMAASRPVVLLQRQVAEAFGNGPTPLSCAEARASAPRFAAETLSRATLVTETPHFCVYAP